MAPEASTGNTAGSGSSSVAQTASAVGTVAGAAGQFSTVSSSLGQAAGSVGTVANGVGAIAKGMETNSFPVGALPIVATFLATIINAVMGGFSSGTKKAQDTTQYLSNSLDDMKQTYANVDDQSTSDYTQAIARNQ